MSALFFEDYRVGAEYLTPARTITEADIALFAGLSGDYNPLHTDEEFARTTPYGTRIAHGVLGLAVVTGLKQRLGHGEGTTLAFLGLTWNFKAAVLAGDTMRARVRITGTRPSRKPGRGVVTQQVELLNQRGEVVADGEHTLLVRSRSDAAPAPLKEETSK